MSTYQKLLQYKVLASVYVVGIVTYNAVGCYDSALQTLKRFDNKQLLQHERHLTTQWDAVKFGSSYQYGSRLFDSIIFPVTVVNNAIPLLVLKLHGRQ
jgi:hypothetical protein